jgi:hypothetical protein
MEEKAGLVNQTRRGWGGGGKESRFIEKIERREGSLCPLGDMKTRPVRGSTPGVIRNFIAWRKGSVKRYVG